MHTLLHSQQELCKTLSKLPNHSTTLSHLAIVGRPMQIFKSQTLRARQPVLPSRQTSHYLPIIRRKIVNNPAERYGIRSITVEGFACNFHTQTTHRCGPLQSSDCKTSSVASRIRHESFTPRMLCGDLLSSQPTCNQQPTDNV